MSEPQQPVTAEPEEPDIVADLSWIGRDVMVTYTNFTPYYDGVVTRITEDGDYVEVEAELRRYWPWSRVRKECEWHPVELVNLIQK
jgi:hypothetical protein